MANKTVAALILSMSPLFAFADPEAIQVPESLRTQPEVQAMINEYNRIAASSPICNDRKNFGLRTFGVDGVPTVRYYVDGKGLGCIPSRLKPDELWLVTKKGWKEEDWWDYQNFVYKIGVAVETGKCATVDTCMIGSTNPLRTATDAQAFHYADCADFPYYLRAYFSFRRGLPYTYATSMRPRDLELQDQERVNNVELQIKEMNDRVARGEVLSKEDNLRLEGLKKQRKLFYDPRYSLNGNWVAKRGWILKDSPVRFYRWITESQNSTSTATLRVWRNENYTAVVNGKRVYEEEPDFYSPPLTPRGIVPGTVVYKHDGHAGVVYRIDYKTGKIYYMDSHPDNTISWGVIDENWTNNMAGRGNLGAGFKNFRPIIREGFIFKTNHLMATDEDLRGYHSDEQYRLFEDPNAQVPYSVNGSYASVNYIDFLRLRMSNGAYHIDPVAQFKEDLGRVCRNMQIRRYAVEEATEKGFHLLPHPARLPDNIYGASGDWEKYSTPGRDVLFKQRVLNLIGTVKKYKGMIESRHPLIDSTLTFEDLKGQIIQAWKEEASACRISYRASNGAERTFSLLEAIQRTPHMSYDPYMCPERRFGATSPVELATCTDTPDKAEWHLYQQFLRNHADKQSTEPMGWSLDELKILDRTEVDRRLVERLDVEKAVRGM